MTVDAAYQMLYIGALIVLSVLIGAMLIRSVIGPRITDRILAINMLGTMVICSIAILSRMLGEGYLVDVALIYAMISFVAVLILATTYLPADPKQPLTPEEEEAGRRRGVRRRKYEGQNGRERGTKIIGRDGNTKGGSGRR